MWALPRARHSPDAAAYVEPWEGGKQLSGITVFSGKGLGDVLTYRELMACSLSLQLDCKPPEGRNLLHPFLKTSFILPHVDMHCICVG